MNNNTMILILVALVLMSAFFSATETAFSSLNKIKLKNQANNGDKHALKTYNLSENYSRLISTILIGNNIVNILMTSLATVLFVKLLGEDLGVTYSTIIITVTVLIFGEITPKTIAKEMPEAFAMAVTPVISVLVTLLKPITFIFDQLKRLISYVFKVESDDTYSSDEFITIVEEAHNEGEMDDHEADLLTNAIEFNDLDVKEILTPRVDVVAVDIRDSLDEIEKKFRESGFSRLPVYRDNVDNIIGVLHEKDFYYLYYTKTKTSLKQILQRVIYTSPHVKISALLRQLQSSKSHLAVVIDEYGGTAGIITMEDILEELVGEIYDEHDEIEEFYKKIDDNTYLVKGDLDIDDMFEYFNIVTKEEYDFVTTSGWVIHNCDCIPQIGQEFDFENLHITVTDADAKKVNEIKVEIKEPDNEESNDSHFMMFNKKDKESD